MPETRGSSRWLGFVGLAALVAASLAAQPAQAGQVTASSVLTLGNNAPTVTYSLNGAAPRTVYAGAFTTTIQTSSVAWLPAGTALETYCVDLSINLSSGTVTPAEVSQTNVASLNDANSVARNIGAAGWVLSNYGVYGETVGATASGLLNDLNLTSASLNDGNNWSDARAEAAIQVAIWKAAYDSNSTDVSTGDLEFTSINADVATVANAILVARGVKTAVIGFVNYPPILNGAQTPINQDQIFVLPDGSLQAIPEPSTLAMAAFGGLIGLGMLGRKRLRERKAAA
ncbi:thioester domain-containing protein [Tautonia sp. JC769]|uniref:thioester domain-containing protein n=1 Tax=Tautonia sp. JC769 TaxID=3232135 RepID=UPI00345816DB